MPCPRTAAAAWPGSLPHKHAPCQSSLPCGSLQVNPTGCVCSDFPRQRKQPQRPTRKPALLPGTCCPSVCPSAAGCQRGVLFQCYTSGTSRLARESPACPLFLSPLGCCLASRRRAGGLRSGSEEKQAGSVSTRGKDHRARSAGEALWCGLVPQLLFFLDGFG